MLHECREMLDTDLELTIRDIGLKACSSLDLGDHFDELAALVQGLFASEGLSVILLSNRGRSLSIRHTAGPSVHGRMPGDVFPFDGSLSEAALSKGGTVLMDGSAPLIPYPGAVCLVKAGYKTTMATPLVSDGEPIGVLTSSSILPHAFDDAEVSVIERLAPHIAVAVANSEAFDLNMRRYRALREADRRLKSVIRELQGALQAPEQGGRGFQLRGMEAFAADLDRAIMPILGFSALLLLAKSEDLADESSIRHYLRLINDTSQRAAALVQEMRSIQSEEGSNL